MLAVAERSALRNGSSNRESPLLEVNIGPFPQRSYGVNTPWQALPLRLNVRTLIGWKNTS